MPVMLKRGAAQTGVPWLDALNAPESEPAPLPADASLWQRAKRGISQALNDPGGEILGMANPMEVASLAPVAVSLIRKASPGILRSKLAMAIPEGISEGSRRGLQLVQDALYGLAESHPRVMSHFRRVTTEVPQAIEGQAMSGPKSWAHFDALGTGYGTRTKGINQVKDRALARGGAFELNFNPAMMENIKSAEDAAQLVGHEVGGHAVHTLMDPSRADLAYQALLKRTGYRNPVTGAMSHPAEILSESAGWKRAGRQFADWSDASPQDLLTGSNPTDKARQAWKAAREAFSRQGVAEGGWTPTP